MQQTNKQSNATMKQTQDGRIVPGDRIMYVNSSQLQHASLDTAVQVEQEIAGDDDHGDRTVFFVEPTVLIFLSNVDLLNKYYSQE